MQTKIMSIFTRTPLHVGCGSSVGAVDQPVVRERHTGYPVIPGSSVKGVLADLWTDKDENGKYVREREGVELLGHEAEEKDKENARAGSLLIGEGKLLAFPVRSAKGCWAWLTCPLALKRFARDCGIEVSAAEPDGDKAYAGAKIRIGDNVVFEEYPLGVCGDVPAVAVDALKRLADDPVWTENVADHLAVVSDDLFAYFAKNACEIANHNRIDDEKGVVVGGALFSQENVPSETLFYAVCTADGRVEDAFCKLERKVAKQSNKLQIGADATTGLGWCSVSFVK